MVIITSSQLGMGSSEWPQIQEGRTLMAPSSSARVMEQAGGLKNPTDPSLKCPRCDSSNTKFCYYNNYSLSQPRHFCKTCKRYWTRGGTLRNVPVGGGCRKNKRVKKINVSHDHHGISSSHLEPASAPANTVCSSQSILPPSNSLPVPSLRAASSAAATTATTTTANNLQSSIFLNSELNVNSSFLSSLKSLLPSGLGSFSAKESTTEGNFLLGQTGMNNTVLQLPSAASFFPVTAFPHLGNSLEFLNGHVSNDTISEAEWRQVQQQNFFLPLEELGSASAQPKVSEVAMRNMEVKIEKERNRIRQLDWQDSNHGMFETNNNSEASLYWNTSLGTWPDVPNYSSSSIASLM